MVDRGVIKKERVCHHPSKIITVANCTWWDSLLVLVHHLQQVKVKVLELLSTSAVIPKSGDQDQSAAKEQKKKDSFYCCTSNCIALFSCISCYLGLNIQNTISTTPFYRIYFLYPSGDLEFWGNSTDRLIGATRGVRKNITLRLLPPRDSERSVPEWR